MVLRKYYYLDEDFINSAYSDIFGHVYQEEQITKIDESKASGKVGFNKGLEAEIGGNKGSVDTVKFNAETFSNKQEPAIIQEYFLAFHMHTLTHIRSAAFAGFQIS